MFFKDDESPPQVDVPFGSPFLHKTEGDFYPHITEKYGRQNMYKSVVPHSHALLKNGVIIHPIVTLESEHGGRAHVWIDDGCYVLGLVTAGDLVLPTTHIFPEAFDCIRKLPLLPTK